jgi:hypothetical protein
MERVRLDSRVTRSAAETSTLRLEALVPSTLTKNFLVSSVLSKQVSAVSTIYIEEL